jgi:hypothetical protein
MRRFFMAASGAVMACTITTAGYAATVNLKQRHSETEIKATCAREGGSFYSNSQAYGCSKACTPDVSCAVDCQKATKKCIGTTPRMVDPSSRPNTVLGGGALRRVGPRLMLNRGVRVKGTKNSGVLTLARPRRPGLSGSFDCGCFGGTGGTCTFTQQGGVLLCTKGSTDTCTGTCEFQVNIPSGTAGLLLRR